MKTTQTSQQTETSEDSAQYIVVHIPEQKSKPAGIIKRLAGFARKNIVLMIALVAAVITSVIIPPDREYLGYFDVKTLSCLFCVLAVVCALKNINFFYILARSVVKRFGNLRLCVIAVVYITFIGSMFIANDMALLTFLPLGYFVLSGTGNSRSTAITFILQNIAANLGGMLTPFGNPQNLYLYSKFNIPVGEFMMIMLLPFIISITLITLCCVIFIKPVKIEFPADSIKPLPKSKTAIYLVLFALSIAIVFRGIPYWIGLIVIPAVLIFMDRKALGAVDYPLLATFAAFFVFSGNMARIDIVREFVSSLMNINTLLFSVLSCQFISNVPSAILLSQFTENYPALLVGVNIGGVGTLISSLASLITLREFMKENPSETKKYLLLFHAMNFSFLVLLTAVMLFLI
jgi:Na+/H+ antiporter NhaD/arsenite permease-like protein